ncbi:hypothetical protein HFK74_18120|uniref:hypothetical protein n=1 Tax=Pseudomonas sp. SbOxS1 TaxID=2723884 RepID=UPI0015D0FF23|nr:hypothetical protein [Pseudomonas sp. SbOxS1]NYU04615.1 hypothetical protein [Pseudomonas sp. SbOxS1]
MILKRGLIIVSLFLGQFCFGVSAEEVVVGVKAGSIVFHEKGSEVVYEGVVGDKDGFHRKLISINGMPALWVSSRYDYYYTLIAIDGGLVIDCAYFDGRNVYNGVRASAGVCGLNAPLSENYEEIAQGYSNEWRKSLYSFDTSPVYEKRQASSFFLTKIGDVVIYDRYPSQSALENATPQKYIKTNVGCYDFKAEVGFLVFLNKGGESPKYLDVLRSVDPIKLDRMSESDLAHLAKNKCS